MVAMETVIAGGAAWASHGPPHTCQGESITGVSLEATNGNDVIHGTYNIDVVAAGEGDDYVSLGAADDYLCGNEGDDTLIGGPDRDRINGGACLRGRPTSAP